MGSDFRKKYAKEGIKASIKAETEVKKAKKSKVEDFLDPEKNPDKAGYEATGEWEELKKYTFLHFPEIVEHEGVSANQALCAIAHACGWSNAKISRESGINDSNIARWLKSEDIKYLINEFRLKEGDKEPAELVVSNKYRGLKLMEHVLSLPPAIDNMDLLKLQMDLAKFLAKKDVGDADQNINVKGAVSYADVAEQIHKKKMEGDISLTDEEEDELFH